MASAVAEYYTTFQKFSGGKTSVQYLRKPIHNPGYKNEQKKWTKNVEKERTNAQELQKILQEIKIYAKNKKNGNYIEIAAYDKILDIFQQLKTMRGQSMVDIFRREQKESTAQHAFEEDMVDLQKALIQILNPAFLEAMKGLKLALGQSRTNITLTDEQWTNPAIQALLKNIDVKSKKFFENKINEYRIKDENEGFFRVLQSVEGKIDFAAVSVEVTQNLNFSGADKLIKLNTLLENATFTLKNYKSGKTIELGSTNIFRLLMTAVNRFDSKLSKDGQLSFVYALINSHLQGKDPEIERHLGHLQVIYELTGMGQQYVSKSEDIEQLKKYAQQGAKYLIVNTNNNDKIQVVSTKDLLLNLLDEKKDYAAKYDHFQHTVTVGRTILNNLT